MAKPAKPAKVDPSDVSVGWQGSASGSGSFARSTQSRTLRLCITHKPSGITLDLEHGPAFLSKTAWKAKKGEMLESLMARLEVALAKLRRQSRPKP